MQKFDVTLGWVGEIAQIVTVPTTLGAEAAERRAKFALAALHPRRNLDNLVVLQVEALPEGA